MAITVTHIQGEASTANTQSTVHATSFLPVDGRTYLLILRATAGSSLSGATPTATHGGTGLTLTLVTGTHVHSQAGAIASGCKLCAFVGTASGSMATGVFTTDTGVPAGAGVDSQQYELIELTGVDTTTPIPQDDVLQENNTADGTITLTLAGAFVNAGSFTLSACSVSNGNTDPVIPTGWASLQSRANVTPAGRLTVAFEDGNDSTADWTGYNAGGTEDLAGFIIEIAEAVAGGAAPKVARLIGGSVLTDGIV